MNNAQKAMAYLKANNFIQSLKRNIRYLSFQEYQTLRGQAIKGDIEGAQKGLIKILTRGGFEK